MPPVLTFNASWLPTTPVANTLKLTSLPAGSGITLPLAALLGPAAAMEKLSPAHVSEVPNKSAAYAYPRPSRPPPVAALPGLASRRHCRWPTAYAPSHDFNLQARYVNRLGAVFVTTVSDVRSS
jgi:hypothetical protein